MRVLVQIAQGKGCTAYGGCGLTLFDPTKMQQAHQVSSIEQFRNNDRFNDDKRLIRFPKTNKDFFFLLTNVYYFSYLFYKRT